MKYQVDLQEVWVQTFEVEADSPEEASERVLDGEGEVVDTAFEYSHSLDSVHDVRLVEEENTT